MPRLLTAFSKVWTTTHCPRADISGDIKRELTIPGNGKAHVFWGQS